jgi:DNA modification methylase
MELKLIHGNCLLVMRALSAESFDLVVTLPPYNLGIVSGHCSARGLFEVDRRMVS